MAKAALAVLSTGIFATMAFLTFVFGGGPQAHADDPSGAGETITKSTAPTEIETPSAAPAVKAEPWTG